MLDANDLGTFCTEADHPEKQTCYNNIENNDRLFNVLLSKRIRTSELPAISIHFQISR